MEQHDVLLAREAQVHGLDGALGDPRHGDGLEHRLQEREHLAGRGRLRRQRRGAAGEFLAAAAGRDQADAGLDQADVAFQRQHAVRGMHQEFAAAAQRHALHGRHGGDLRVLEGLRGALELLDGGFQHVPLAGGAGFGHLLQVGAHGERGVMPDHQAIELALGAGHGLQDAFQHLGAQRVVLGRDRQDGDAGVDLGQVPQAHAFVFPHRGAAVVGAFAEHALGEQLALIDRQGRARVQLAAARRIRAGGRVHALAVGLQGPGRQRRVAHGAAGGDVLGHGAGDGLPAGGLPGLERALGPAEAPAHGQVQVAGVVGHLAELRRAVVEDVAEQAPQELRLRMLAGAQRGEAPGRIAFLEQRGDLVGQLAGAGAVVLRLQVQHLDLAAGLAVDAGAALLAQRALGDQGRQPGGQREIAVPGIVRQVLVHGADHVGQRIQADHVGGAVSGALGAADLGAGEGIDLVKA